MGHAGAIIMGNAGSAQSKIDAFEKADVKVAERPVDVTELVASALRR
jgi:succinyl-CoA synthetase alpha subunit